MLQGNSNETITGKFLILPEKLTLKSAPNETDKSGVKFVKKALPYPKLAYFGSSVGNCVDRRVPTSAALPRSGGAFDCTKTIGDIQVGDGPQAQQMTASNSRVRKDDAVWQQTMRLADR